MVRVINTRKGHSNFQLIIITHDENFLAKLGQSEVMEYYWSVFQDYPSFASHLLICRRVSRDARQKSVIERQRFR